MLKCKILGKNLINGVEQEFSIKEGAVFTENYNETLDSGTIILPQLTSKIEIEPYDVVYIYSTDDSPYEILSKRLCVDTYTCTQTSLDPAIYQYQITLFSETKLLEGILLPNLSITKKYRNQITINQYLQSILDQYSPKMNSSASQGAYGNEYILGYNVNNSSDTIQSRFSQIECPEMQWNEPTLREVINDLLMVDSCIVVLNANRINFIDITQIGNEITTEQRKGINYIQESQSSADYVSEIKSKIINSVGEDEKTRICEKITFRNNDTYILTTENVRVETSFPIYNLINCSIFVPVFTRIETHPEGGGLVYSYLFKTYVEVILYSNTIKKILEYGEWQTKDIYYAGFSSTQNYSTDYQNTCLYYIRGQKGIHNFEAKQDYKVLWINNQVSVLQLFCSDDALASYVPTIKSKFLEVYPEYAEGYTLEVYQRDETKALWKETYFILEYETEGQYTLLASKKPFPKNKRQIIDNQTQNYVNAKRYGMLEYLKANRLGNKVKLINGRYEENEVDIPRLARTINGSIIFRKEISVYENYIKANYQATDNYVLRDYFTGIKSKLRSWKILTGNEAFIRSDVIKFYIKNTMPSIDNNYKIPVYSNINNYFNSMNYCVIKFRTGTNTYLPRHQDMLFENFDYGVDGYMVEFQKVVSGNSLLINIKMQDNAIVGKYVSNDNFDASMSGLNARVKTQQNCKYVDDNGENLGGIIYFYQNYNIENLSIYEPQEPEDEDDEPESPEAAYERKLSIMNALHNLLPAVPTSGDYNGFSNLIAKIPFNFKKDNREITQITIQIEMNNDENINDMFMGYNKFR